MSDVLAGIRVVEVADWGFVPSAATVLGDWGAEVVKIEHPRYGDPIRGLVTSGLIPGASGRNFFVEHLGRNKRSIGIDLGHPDGRALLDRLIARADVFLTSFLDDARERLRITWDDLRAVNPRLIYARGSGQGRRGPDARRGGYDGVSFWARGGVADRLSTTGQPPLQQRPAFGDFIGGMAIAGGIAAALFQRERTGEGLEVDVSLLGTALWVLSPDITAALMYGFMLPAAGDMPSAPNPLVGTYFCSDGKGLVLMMLQAERFWPIFAATVGRPDILKRYPAPRPGAIRPLRSATSWLPCSPPGRARSGKSACAQASASGGRSRRRSTCPATRRCRRTATSSPPRRPTGRSRCARTRSSSPARPPRCAARRRMRAHRRRRSSSSSTAPGTTSGAGRTPASSPDAMPRPSPLQAHPWHGVPAGEQAPDIVNVFIELVPTDTVKYEVDKPSGHLKLDRPQQFSNLCPAPYGFVPRTWCKSRVAALAMEATGRTGVVGDGDPVDICVLTERPINHGSILLRARPIGGLRLFDRHEADDKLVGVLVNDPAFGDYTELAQVPRPLVDRLRHYFLTYKQIPDPHAAAPVCEITHVYDAATARDVVRRAIADYEDEYA